MRSTTSSFQHTAKTELRAALFIDAQAPKDPAVQNTTTIAKIVNYHAVVFLLRPQILQCRGPFLERKNVLLCLLSRRILWIFFSCLPGNFALKNGGDFWWIFSGLRLPRNEARKSPREIRGKFGANFGAKFGTKIRKIRELPFCNFSDLKMSVTPRKIVSAQAAPR